MSLKSYLRGAFESWRGSHRSVPNYDTTIAVDAGTVAAGGAFYYTPPSDGHLVIFATNMDAATHFEAKLGSLSGSIIGSCETSFPTNWAVGVTPVQKGRTICVGNFSMVASGLLLELHPYIGS